MKFFIFYIKYLLVLLLAFCANFAHAQSDNFQKLLDQAGISFEVVQKGKAILVNIPAYEMILFHDGKPVMRSKVIVGAPWHRTPRLKTHVSSVRFARHGAPRLR